MTDSSETTENKPERNEESAFTCRYGHGSLREFNEVIALPVTPPWHVAQQGSELSGCPPTVTANPPHLRMRILFCEHCTYSELHYVRDNA